MLGILDQIKDSSSSFIPANVVQFTVLQIARKLNDTFHLYEYLRVADSQRPVFLIQAFKDAVRNGADFFVQLKNISGSPQ